MIDNSKKGWEFFFSTYPKDLTLSKEIKIISEKYIFNEAIKESIDKLNLDEMSINISEDSELSKMFLDKVINLETGDISMGKEAKLTFEVNNLADSLANKIDSNIKYPMETLNHLAIPLATDAMKSKKDSMIVFKKVNLKEHMEKLKAEAKKDKNI